MQDHIENYYKKYQTLKEETLASTKYKNQVQNIKEQSKDKYDLQEKINDLKETIMNEYSLELKPYLEKIFEMYDVNNNGYLSRDEANNLFKVYLVKERVLRAKHNVDLRLKSLNTSTQKQKELRALVHIKKDFFNQANGKKLDVGRIDESMINDAIKEIYIRDYLSFLSAKWHEMYDAILSNKASIFSRSLFITIDTDFDGKLRKEELVKNFTKSFVSLTHNGIKNISKIEKKYLKDEFYKSLNGKVHVLLKEKLQTTSTKINATNNKNNHPSPPVAAVEKKKGAGGKKSNNKVSLTTKTKEKKKPLKLKLTKSDYSKEEKSEPLQMCLLSTFFIIAIIGVILFGDLSVLLDLFASTNDL
jgi:hypothetical protein